MADSLNENVRKLSRFTISAGLVWFVFCAIAFSNAGSNILAVVAIVYVTGFWGLTWLIRLGISIWRQRQGKSKFKYCLLFWLFEPIVLIGSLVLSFGGVFSDIRFAISEKALDSYVEDVRNGKVDLAFEFNHPSRQIGLYYVTFTDLMADGTVRVLTSSHSLMDRAGFAKSANNPPPKQGEDSYKPIHRQWWYWYESW